MTTEENSLQGLCNEIMDIGDMLACYIVDTHGRVKGKDFGETPMDDVFKSRFGELTGVIWSGLKEVEHVGGPLTMNLAIYENFKILGIPVQGTNDCILAVTPLAIDANVLQERILDYVKYWRRKSK